MKFKYMKGYLKGWWPAVLNLCRGCHQGHVFRLAHKGPVDNVKCQKFRNKRSKTNESLS